MNQIIKDKVYGKGNIDQVRFIAERGGMTTEEYSVFVMLHERIPDEVIQQNLGIDKKTFARIEESISAKVFIAVFECINRSMDLLGAK